MIDKYDHLSDDYIANAGIGIAKDLQAIKRDPFFDDCQRSLANSAHSVARQLICILQTRFLIRMWICSTVSSVSSTRQHMQPRIYKIVLILYEHSLSSISIDTEDGGGGIGDPEDSQTS
jgi:hypothetical protein